MLSLLNPAFCCEINCKSFVTVSPDYRNSRCETPNLTGVLDMRQQFFHRLFWSLLVIFGGWAVTASADEDTIQKTFTVSPGGTLTIDACIGSIDVNSGSSDEVTVEIKHQADLGYAKEAKRLFDELDIRFEQRGNNVFVYIEHEDKGRFFDRLRQWRLKLHITAVVPHEFNVDLKTSGGGISVDDLKGKVDAKTSGGGLTFGKIEGPVTGRTSGGGISLKECRGVADINTSGGGIDIGEVEGDVKAHTSGGSLKIVKAAGIVNASTSGGGITVEEVQGTIDASTSGGSVTAKITMQPESNCSLTTSGGSINVYVANDLKFTVDAKTSGGGVSTEFPVTIQGEINKSQLQADINGGGPRLYLRTSGGGIHIKKLGDI
jgi:hypothetical protein